MFINKVNWKIYELIPIKFENSFLGSIFGLFVGVKRLFSKGEWERGRDGQESKIEESSPLARRANISKKVK